MEEGGGGVGGTKTDHGTNAMSQSQSQSQQWPPPSAVGSDFSAFQSIQSITNAELDALIQSYDRNSGAGGNANGMSALGGDHLEQAGSRNNGDFSSTFPQDANDAFSQHFQSSDADMNTNFGLYPMPSLEEQRTNPAAQAAALALLPSLEDQRTNPAAAAATAAALATNQFLPSAQLSNAVDWSKVGIPESLSRPPPPVHHRDQRAFMLPGEINAALAASGVARHQQNHIQPARASWDGTTASPAPFEDPRSQQQQMRQLQPSFPFLVQGGGSSSGSSNMGMASNFNVGAGNPTAIPLGSEGESSDAGNTSAGSTKRRRMTISGVDSLHEAGRGRPHVQPQQSHQSHQSQDQSWQRQIQQQQQRSGSQQQHFQQQPSQQQPQQQQPGAPGQNMAAPAHHRSRKHQDQSQATNPSAFLAREQSSSGLVNSKQLEEMATESLQRASAENRRTTDREGHLSAMPPNFAASSPTQQQHTSPQRPSMHRQRSTTGAPTETSRYAKRYSGPDPANLFESSVAADASSMAANAAAAYAVAPRDSHIYHSNSAFATVNPGHMGGSAASHPPGLGASILKGQDPALLGTAAANDFTRRKGWSNRVVDELLDFAHVLDPMGKILYATNSVQGLTGWKPSELKGMNIYDIVHPQDLPALRRELQSALNDPAKEITMYYRIKRSPAQIASRAKTRLASASNEKQRMQRSRSNSETTTTTPTDSSSLQTPSESTSCGAADGVGPGGRRGSAKTNPATLGEVDPDAEWVTMEMTGHAYFPPTAVAQEHDEELQEQAKEQEVAKNAEGASDEGDEDEDEEERARRLSRTNAALDEERKAKYSGNTSPVIKAKTYELPLERETVAQCLFCSCRVYPTKSVLLLDSFLELKLENEKLRLELEQLNLNEDRARFPRDTEHGPSVLRSGPPPPGARTSFDASMGGGGSQVPGESSGGVDLQEASRPRPGHPNALQGRVGGVARALQTTSGSGDSSTVTTSGVDDGEADGEGSGSASTLTSDAAAGAAALLKKKKAKMGEDDEDRVCTDCGRTDSPEWRKGPLGPKTLCNACGLRYAKKVKRQPGPIRTNGAGGSPDLGAAGSSSLASSPTQPSTANPVGAGVGMAPGLSGGGMPGGGMAGSGGSPMMPPAPRPPYSTMNSFATDSSIAGSDFRAFPMEQMGSFQQRGGQAQTPSVFQSPTSAVPGGQSMDGMQGNRFSQQQQQQSHQQHHHPMTPHHFSQDYSMAPQRPQFQQQHSHQHSSSMGNIHQAQMMQQVQQQRQQQLEFQEMQQRHHQQHQHLQHQHHNQLQHGGNGGGGNGGHQGQQQQQGGMWQ